MQTLGRLNRAASLRLVATWGQYLRWLMVLVLLAAALPARSDSVGQVQTTKFFAPETVTLLKSRLTNNTPGFVVGDLVSYIIQFTPVPNHSNVGAGGYITDYIPSGTEVVGAWFVEPDGSGSYRSIPPPSPPLMVDGWSTRGRATYTVSGGTSWTTSDSFTVAACTAAYITGTNTLNNCNGRLSEVYADTGIFYSTDPRTQVYTYPNTDGRARQGTNGYYINPTGLEETDYNNNLNTLLGQAKATVHNYWDAANVNAFGTEVMPTDTPRATNLPMQTVSGASNGPGRGSSPFNAGSAVAGPDTGYKLDYTGSVGPWRRISYPGSMVGKTSNGPAINSTTDVVAGSPTSAGYILSTSNPLPSNTNAVRWAAGNLTVGVMSHVKITLRLTAPVPAAGLINNSEVFGGDSSPVGLNYSDANGTSTVEPGNRESAWRYTVPSVADNNSNLLITKEIVCVFKSGTCTPISGTVVPDDPKIRYRILYLNTGNSFQTNVVLKEMLDTAASAAGNLYIISGTDLRPSSPSLSVNSAAVGATRGADAALTTVTGGTTVTFPPLVSLPPAMGGGFEIDVQYNTSPGDILSNVATLVTTQVPDGARATSSVIVDQAANLLISKSTSTPSVAPGGTATYTIKVTNVGSATATSIIVRDFLPFEGTTNDSTKRFEYLTTTSVITGLTSVSPAVARPPTVSPYNGNTNQQQVTWTFGTAAGRTLAPGNSVTLVFSARVGSTMTSSTYYNDAIVEYNNGSTQAQTLNNRLNDAAPVVVTSPFTITKTVDCIYSGSTCYAYTGSEQVPASGKLRYKISYANTSAVTQTNVYLCDALPTQVASYAAAVSTPSTAPSPTGPYLDSPSIGSRTNPANTACGLTGTTFSYAVGSMAAGATGTAYIDVQTNAASGSTLINTAKIVSTQSTGGASSTVYNSVRDEARLVISKTASTSSISPNGTVNYTITVTNTGNAAAKTMTVYDFLPYYSATANPATRFGYVTATSVISGLTTVSPATVTVPTIAPYSSNTNQEQASWYFGAQSLAAGGSFSITFQAKAGASIPVGTTVYTNDAQVVYSTGSGTATAYVSAAAPVTVATNLSIVKTIDCIYNSANTVCNAYDGSGIVPVNGKIRYKMVYTNTGGTAQSNVYVCDTLPTQISGIGAVTTPSIAPTPSGNYLDSPSLGTRTTSANALCLLSGGTTFNYPVIASLAGGASGTVYYDVQTNAASGATVLNTGKVVSGYAPSGVVSSVSATALSVPNVGISKSTSSTKLAPGQTATYTITLTNAGSTATTSLKVYDFLPYSGTTNNSALRFNYVSGSSTYSGGLPTPTITAVVSPTVTPYNSNTNQQQVLWDFGNYQMAAGATATITFNAVSGASMPAASYGNTAMTIFTGTAGSGTNAVIDTATVSLSSPPTIAKAFDAPKAVSVSGLTTLTFTLTNPNSFALTGGSFTDDFPAGTVLGATTLGGTCSSGTLTSRASTGATAFSTATTGHISIQVAGFTVPASGSCTVQVKVQGSSAGAKVNTSSVLTSTNVVNSTGTASDTLNVYATPTVTKAFGTSTISASGTTTLSITLGNPAGNPGSLTGINVTDVFPTAPGAMTVASTGSTNGCSGGSGNLQGKTGAAAYGSLAVGNTAIQLTGLTLAPGANCTVVVTITASTAGSYTNTTTAVLATGPIALTGSVSNTATLVVNLLYPNLEYQKTVVTLNDPVNGSSSPKRIPGAEVRYTIRITNTGPGTVDNNSMVLVDPIPPNTELYVGDLGLPSGPIGFTSSTSPASGLNWTYTSLGNASDDISFSKTASPPYAFTYVPVPDGNGYDGLITAIRLNPKGTMAAAGSGSPYVEFQFKVRIK